MPLAQQVLVRVASGIGLLIAASGLCFLLGELAPGEPLSHLRLDPAVSPEMLATLKAEFGLEQPITHRYGRWLLSLLGGDWGYSHSYHQPVWGLLRERAPATLGLVVVAWLAAWGLALPLALRAAHPSGTLSDRTLFILSATLQALPTPVLALALLAFAASSELLPSRVDASPAGAFGRWLWPGLTLILATLPQLLRQARVALGEAIGSPAVMAARTRGLSEARILSVHVLSLAARPLIGLAALTFAGLLSASLVVEVIFGLPGLGPLVLDAILARDLYLSAGGVLVAALWLQGSQLGADLLLDLADPRVRRPKS